MTLSLLLMAACSVEADPTLDPEDEGQGDVEAQGPTGKLYRVDVVTVGTSIKDWDIDGSPPDLYIQVWVDNALVLDTSGYYKSNEWNGEGYVASWTGPFKTFALRAPSRVYVRVKDYDPTVVNYDTTVVECERLVWPTDVTGWLGHNVTCTDGKSAAVVNIGAASDP